MSNEEYIANGCVLKKQKMFEARFSLQYFLLELVEALWSVYVLHTKHKTAHLSISKSTFLRDEGHIKLTDFDYAKTFELLPNAKSKADWKQFHSMFLLDEKENNPPLNIMGHVYDEDDENDILNVILRLEDETFGSKPINTILNFSLRYDKTNIYF